MYIDLALYIDGQFLSGEGRLGEPVINPATGQALAELPHATTDDLDRAVAAAARAFETWRRTSAYDRGKILSRGADLIRERLDAIAEIMTLEQGKPLAESKGETLHAADILDWCAEEGRRAYGRVIPGRDPKVRQMVLMEPVGPAAAFTPWLESRPQISRDWASAITASRLTPTRATSSPPALRTRHSRASCNSTWGSAALPASSLAEAAHTASHAPRSDQANETGSTAARSVRSITA